MFFGCSKFEAVESFELFRTCPMLTSVWASLSTYRDLKQVPVCKSCGLNREMKRGQRKWCAVFNTFSDLFISHLYDEFCRLTTGPLSPGWHQQRLIIAHPSVSKRLQCFSLITQHRKNVFSCMLLESHYFLLACVSSIHSTIPGH